MDRRYLTLSAVGLVALLVIFGIWAAQPPEAAAQTNFIHGTATGCAQCHHSSTFDAGFRPCSDCHDPSFAQAACTQCHTGYTTTGATCWSCHIPAKGAPPHTDASCRLCHPAEPHLGSSPACTSCHTQVGPDSPHHDAIDQKAPTQCTDCHTGQESHGRLTCTTCHKAFPHPNLPEVPAACNLCHPALVFNGRGDCLACHTASGGFDGFTDEDIHDSTLPDAPISGRSCSSCHPGKERHAQQVACVDCHTQATAFHHGTAPDTGIKACADCHGQKQQHGTGLACTACHVGVQHLSDPLSVVPIAGCKTCHPPAEKGTKNCLGCHRPPIYHVTPSVGGCSSCHGSGRASHAGVVKCTQCHTNIDRGHHITSVVRPACTTAGCHTTFEPHQPGVKCTDCHGRGAVHDSTPRNLPADTWSVCARCHSFVRTGLAAGLPACSECHDTTQHNADYRVPACTTCHQDKAKHAGKVDCRLCHTNLDKGHHRAGKVSTRACSSCHVGAAIHASGTTAGAAFTCGTCHEGTVHGVLGLPRPKDCIACHEKAPDHAGDFACIECHWPAAHSALPDASIFGSFTPLALDLPTIPASGEKGQVEERGTFTGTGFQMLAALAAAVVLIGTGFFLRRRKL